METYKIIPRITPDPVGCEYESQSNRLILLFQKRMEELDTLTKKFNDHTQGYKYYFHNCPDTRDKNTLQNEECANANGEYIVAVMKLAKKIQHLRDQQTKNLHKYYQNQSWLWKHLDDNDVKKNLLIHVEQTIAKVVGSGDDPTMGFITPDKIDIKYLVNGMYKSNQTIKAKDKLIKSLYTTIKSKDAQLTEMINRSVEPEPKITEDMITENIGKINDLIPNLNPSIGVENDKALAECANTNISYNNKGQVVSVDKEPLDGEYYENGWLNKYVDGKHVGAKKVSKDDCKGNCEGCECDTKHILRSQTNRERLEQAIQQVDSSDESVSDMLKDL